VHGTGQDVSALRDDLSSDTEGGPPVRSSRLTGATAAASPLPGGAWLASECAPGCPPVPGRPAAAAP